MQRRGWLRRKERGRGTRTEHDSPTKRTTTTTGCGWGRPRTAHGDARARCASVRFDGQNSVFEPIRRKVFGGDPILQWSHFSDRPVERRVRPELQKQQAAILRLVGRDLDDVAFT